MVFSSLVFLFIFLPAVLLINHFLPAKARNTFLLFANLIFYAYGEPIYVLLMLASIIMNYLAAALIERTINENLRKFCLILNIIINIGALCFFKYTSLFLDTLRHIPVLSFLPHFNAALPIGISFYTFQAVSYVIDVYRKDCEGSNSFVNFAAYISLFPQLIAGPIVRYSDVERQIRDRHETVDMFNTGIRFFAIGLAKKVLLANQFGIIWNSVSADVHAFGTIGAWIGAVAYSLQIYFDFAGYSDMARGLGKMLGFDFCINFNYPYISRSITEFWRRWHISLSTWFRDYLYIPLGGNRCSRIRNCFNLLIVWMLTGLWHGAGWNFVFWGLYYGVILLLEKNLYGEKLKKLPKVIGHIYTMLVVIIGWIFFASTGFTNAFDYIKVMFTPSGGKSDELVAWLFTLIVGIMASTPLFSSSWGKLKEKKNLMYAEIILCMASLILCCSGLVTESYNPFLYFRF